MRSPFERVAKIHLELTSHCNASCPQCPRNLRGGAVNPTLPLVHLSLEDIRQIFPPDFLRTLSDIRVNGNYGDGSVAPDALESFHYMRAENPGLKLYLHTNGGARGPAWWAELAHIVTECIFGIDGLEDTNHLYRRGVHWDRLMANVRGFISAGGRAAWQFIVFEHNEHQVETAQQLAAELGFKRFAVRRTNRFFRGGTLVDQQTVHGRKGEVEYVLRAPQGAPWRNPAAQELAHLTASGCSHTAYLDATPICCKALDKDEVFVSAEGLVFPCCYTANIYGQGLGPSRNIRQILGLIETMPAGKASLSAKEGGVMSVVRGPFFARIAESWGLPSLETGRLGTCANACGHHDLLKSQTA